MVNGDGHGRVRRAGRWWLTVLTWLLVLIVLLPFAHMAWTAQKPKEGVDAGYRYLYLTHNLPVEEIRRMVGISQRPLRVAAINSMVVSTSCALLGAVLCSMAGYAFAKKRFRGKALLFDLVLISMALPPAILMMPLFRLTVMMHIYDTILALILPFCVTGFGIFFMRYAISAVPDSVVESARLDGLSEAGVLFRVVLPSIWPSVVTLVVLAFLTSWSSFVLPHAVTASPRHYTIAILLGRLMSDFSGLMWNEVMVVVIAALIPVALVFVMFSRWVIRASTAIGNDRAGPR